MFGEELLAVDGSKFKTINSRRKNFTKAKLKKAFKKIDEKSERYLHDMVIAHKEEDGIKKPSAEELKEKNEQMQACKGRYGHLHKL